MTLSADAKSLCKRGDALFSRREGLLSFWQLSADMFYPERADFTQTHSWGREFGAELFDSATMRARRDLGNAFSSMLRPRGQEWFKCQVADTDLMKHQPVKEWCGRATGVMRQLMYATRARFDRATKEGDHDYAAFGQTVLSVEINRENDGLVFRCHHLRDCAWAEDTEGGIDTMFRKFKMTARQIDQMKASMWKDALFSNDLKKAIDKEPDREFTVMHITLPAKDYDLRKGAAGIRLPWVSVYVETAGQTLLSEAGSHEFRYVVPRWQTISNSVYAVSPAVVVSLADARGLQAMARIVIEAGEQQVSPPMLAFGEAIIGDINLYAGGTTLADKAFVDNKQAVLSPIELGKNSVLGVQMIERWHETLAASWYLNKLNLPDHGKTAYETAQLVEEYVRANIPLFEPMEQEYNAPLLEAVASIALRQGAFGPPQEMPRDLAGMDLEFGFSNPLQDAIEKNKTNILNVALGLAAGVAQIDPTAIKRIRWGDAFADAVTGSGAPAEWEVDQEALAQQEEAAADAQQSQAAMGDILGGLNAAGQAADVVSKGADAAAQLQALGGAGVPGVVQ